MPRPAAVLLAAALTMATPPAIVSTTAGNAWLIVVDDLHVEFIQTGRLRNLLRTVANALIHEGDVYQLRSTGPAAAGLQLAGFSTDRSLLPSIISAVNGNGLKLVDAVNVSLEPAPNELLTRANLALDAIGRAMSALAAAETGPKAIVLVSHGYDIDTLPQVADRISALTLRAQVEGTTIFAIDAPRLLPLPDLQLPDRRIDAVSWLRYTTATRRSLTIIAEQTGGFAIERSNEPAAELKRIDAQMR